MPKGKLRHGSKTKSPTKTKQQTQGVAAAVETTHQEQGGMEDQSLAGAAPMVCFRGVKPQCVQGRWFDVQMVQSTNRLQITEMFLSDTERIVHEAPLPAYIEGRVLGQPVCIGCHGNLFILQYHTDRCKYSRFLLVDTAIQIVQKFEDSLHYLNRRYFTVGPVACLISPGLQWVLFRLPPPLQLTNSTWAKVLYAELKRTDGVVTGISNVKVSDWMDRKNQALAFHPQYDNCLTSVFVDQYCSKCEMSMYELSKKDGVIHRTVTLTHKVWLGQVDSSAQGDFLLQLNADYSHSGDVLVLCCTAQDPSTNQVAVKLFVLDSEKHIVIHSMLHYLHWAPHRSRSSQDFMPFSPQNNVNAVLFSGCDTRLSLWQLRIGCHLESEQKLLEVRLPQPRPPLLQALCRAVILQHCPSHKLWSLGLPRRLQAYVSYFQCL